MDAETPIRSAQDMTAKASDTAAQAWETTREKAGEALHTGERYVRDHPGTSVLSIFSIGFLLGLLVGYGMAHEEQTHYAARARKFAKRWGKSLNLY